LWNSNLVAGTLSGGSHPESNVPGRHREDDANLVVGSERDEGMARPLVARATGYRMDLESENFVLADTLRVEYGEQSFRGDGVDNLVLEANTLGAGGHSTNPLDETLIADPISTREGKTYTHEGRNNFRTHNVVEAWQTQGSNVGEMGTLKGEGTSTGNGTPFASGDFGVRRLTPLECERLQGWPDDHTRWTADGKEIPDSHRYRCIGNGVVAPVAEWIGHRLVEVDSWR